MQEIIIPRIFWGKMSFGGNKKKYSRERVSPTVIGPMPSFMFYFIGIFELKNLCIYLLGIFWFQAERFP